MDKVFRIGKVTCWRRYFGLERLYVADLVYESIIELVKDQY